MRKILFGLLFVVTFSTYGQDFEFDYHKDYENVLSQTNDSLSELNYDKLLNRFVKNDTTLTDFEVLALLIGFTDNDYFKPYNYLSTEREIYSLNGNGKFKQAVEKCDSFLIYVPLSQKALIEKSYSFYKLGLQDSADIYSWRFHKIMNAMYNSGNGKTPEAAFFSLGPTDGQNFIKKFFRADIGTMGSGRDKHGNFVDILEMIWKDDNGEENRINLYFQIEHASKTMFSDLDLDKLLQDSDNDKKKKKKRKNKK